MPSSAEGSMKSMILDRQRMYRLRRRAHHTHIHTHTQTQTHTHRTQTYTHNKHTHAHSHRHTHTHTHTHISRFLPGMPWPAGTMLLLRAWDGVWGGGRACHICLAISARRLLCDNNPLADDIWARRLLGGCIHMHRLDRNGHPTKFSTAEPWPRPVWLSRIVCAMFCFLENDTISGSALTLERVHSEVLSPIFLFDRLPKF